jgi:uncharacterized protein YpmB
MKKEKIKILLIIIMVLLLVGSVGATAYFYKKYTDAKKNPNKASNDEVSALVSKVSKNMNLPSDETPTVATVSDVEKLKDQAFFKNVQNGDKLLIYINAKKAIVYRPSSQKIVEFGLVVNDGASANTTSAAKTEIPTPSPLSVVIYNGTEESGLSNEIEKKISELKDLTVTKKAKAGKSDYTQTMVVDLTGSNGARATEIASSVGGIVSTIPEGAEKPEADILVIAGK